MAGRPEGITDGGAFYEQEARIGSIAQGKNEQEIVYMCTDLECIPSILPSPSFPNEDSHLQFNSEGTIHSLRYEESFGNLTAEGLEDSKDLGKKEHAAMTCVDLVVPLIFHAIVSLCLCEKCRRRGR